MCLVSQDAQPGQPRRAGKGSEVVPSLYSASEPRSDQTASAFQDLMAPSPQGQADIAPRNSLGTGNVSTLKIKQQTTIRKRLGKCRFANFPEDTLMESCLPPGQGKALPGLSGIVLWLEVPQSPCVPKCCEGVGEEVWLPAGQAAEGSGLLVQRAWAGESGALLPSTRKHTPFEARFISSA